MSLRRLVVPLTLLSCALAWAQPAPATSAGPAAGGPDNDRQHERFEKKAHLMALLELSDALDLSDAEALKLRATLVRFGERRRPVHKEMKGQAEILRRAAGGDATAFAQVDGAVQKMVALRTQIEQQDQELFKTLSQGLSPQKRAKLALTLAHLPHQMHEAMHEGGPSGNPGHGSARGGAKAWEAEE